METKIMDIAGRHIKQGGKKIKWLSKPGKTELGYPDYSKAKFKYNGQTYDLARLTQSADVDPNFKELFQIEDQIKELENESTPETKILVDDAMIQLNKLEINYKKLEQDLLNGGNSKLILSAMITNFQTRIDLLQEVMDKIENIKTFKNYDDENITI